MTAGGPPQGPGYQAVLFDLGGVVFDSPLHAFAVYEREAGLPEGFLRRLNAANHHDNAWARLERAEVDVEGFVALFEAEAFAAGHRVDARRVLAALEGEPVPAMLAALPLLRAAGLRLAAVTNNVTPLAAGRPGLDLFDVVVQSSVEGVRKPEEEFYRRALERLELAAEACVYLDDLGVNLKPARAMGITTVKVVDPLDALAELQRLLGPSHPGLDLLAG